MNRFRHPEGTRLPALERNILKFRAFEMVLLLFYSEYLKQQIIGTIEASDRWTRKDHPRVTADTKKKFQKATATLVADGIITKEEKDEIGKLVDVRNTIAHNIHEMTFDVSRDTYSRQRLEVERPKYDYDALKRIKYFHKELSKRMMSKYTQVLSMDRILFQAAERTYETELKRLNKKIVAQMEARRKNAGILRGELSLKDTGFENEELYPAHPRNISGSGNLSKRGVEVCFRLFDLGKRPIVVACLMYISAKAARKRHKQWLEAGGINRKRYKIGPLFAKPIRVR